MAEDLKDIKRPLQSVEDTTDGLAQSTAQRFEAPDVALREQREYTEFAYARLDAQMRQGFARMDLGFADMERRFSDTERRFTEMEPLHGD